MKHLFVPHPLNQMKCKVCGFSQIDHTDRATCESCAAVTTCSAMFGMLLCPTCEEREVKLSGNNGTDLTKVNEFIERSKKIDQSINLKSDIFNSHTVAIMELKSSVESDENIPAEKKRFALLELINNRIKSRQDIIFSKRKELIEEENIQRAEQAYLHQEAVRLSDEERASLKLIDINYPPTAPKQVKPKSVKLPDKKFNMKSLRAVADQYNIPMNILQMIANANNTTAEEAAKIHLKNLGQL